jgi:hypothetical protein
MKVLTKDETRRIAVMGNDGSPWMYRCVVTNDAWPASSCTSWSEPPAAATNVRRPPWLDALQAKLLPIEPVEQYLHSPRPPAVRLPLRLFLFACVV